jgi:hypothetical protein
VLSGRCPQKITFAQMRKSGVRGLPVVYCKAGCQHRLFFSQVEYCDNLIFRRRAALDNLGQRLLDANRTIGQPNKIP